jgi:hypothetical protein
MLRNKAAIITVVDLTLLSCLTLIFNLSEALICNLGDWELFGFRQVVNRHTFLANVFRGSDVISPFSSRPGDLILVEVHDGTVND